MNHSSRFRSPLALLGCCCLLLLGSACASTTSQQQEVQKVMEKEASHQELFRKAEATAAIGDLTRAEQYYVASLNSGGPAKEITRRLLVVCVADERFPAALEHATQYLRHHPRDVDVKFAAASIHAALGDLMSARFLLQDVVRDRPAWADAHYALATVLRSQGDAVELAAVHDLEYLRLDPKGPLSEQVRERLRSATP